MLQAGRHPATAELFGAAEEGNLERVQQLIAANADVNAELRDFNAERTPLLHAVGHGHEAIVRLLLDHGAAVNRSGVHGESITPLHKVAFEGHDRIAQLLLDKGANKDAKDDKGKTPATLAREAQAYFPGYPGHDAVIALLTPP